MKKNILLIMLVIIVVFSMTGCKKKVKPITGSFTITCESKNNSMKGVDQTNISVYNFGKDQYIADYEIKTISVYSDKETYEYYKENAEESAKSDDSDKVVYDISSDDDTQTVIFSYKIVLSKDDLKNFGDKDYYKVNNVFDRIKTGAKCSFKGIKEEQIK